MNIYYAIQIYMYRKLALLEQRFYLKCRFLANSLMILFIGSIFTSFENSAHILDEKENKIDDFRYRNKAFVRRRGKVKNGFSM